MKELLARRIATQPLELPNAGTVFRNPPGDHAARLIEACGLKGFARGGARVSEKHANFIVNPSGAASAADIEWLIEHVQRTVYADEAGVDADRRSAHRGGAGMTFGKVAVLLGGKSAEREVSLKSGNGVLGACAQRRGCACLRSRRARPRRAEARGLRARCFIALHGRCGEDGTRAGRARDCWAFPTPAAACSAPRSPWTSGAPSWSGRRAACRRRATSVLAPDDDWGAVATRARPAAHREAGERGLEHRHDAR